MVSRNRPDTLPAPDPVDVVDFMTFKPDCPACGNVPKTVSHMAESNMDVPLGMAAVVECECGSFITLRICMYVATPTEMAARGVAIEEIKEMARKASEEGGLQA